MTNERSESRSSAEDRLKETTTSVSRLLDIEARLKAIEDRLARATPGPWEAVDNSVRSEAADPLDVFYAENGFFSEGDADFIANAPSDLAYLLDLVRKLQK